jgi:hypothetical protein
MSAVTGPFATRATSTAISPDTVAPTIGMNAPRKTTTASGSASGTPQDGGADADTRRVHQRDRERGADVADRVCQAR